MEQIWPKIGPIGIWMGRFFLKNWYLHGSTFKFRGGTSLPKPNLSTPPGPYPSLRVILAEKGTHFQGFCLKNRPIFQKFRGFLHAKTQKFGLSQESWPMFKDFLLKNGTHVLGFLVKKRPIRAAHIRLAKYVSTTPPPPPGCFSQRWHPTPKYRRHSPGSLQPVIQPYLCID